jgi:hypothetical protein
LPTAVLDNWDKVQAWLQQVNTSMNSRDAQLAAIPAFPLTGGELRALQASIDRIARAQAAASPTSAGPSPLRLFESMGHVHWTASILLAVIVCSCVASILNFMLLQGAYATILLTTNVILGLLGILVWASHFVRLAHHADLVHKIDSLKY